MPFREIQKAVIMKEDKFLIILRSPSAPFFPEHWDFPGGKLEHGEDPKEGIAREILEETGLRATIGDVVGVYEMDLIPEVTHRYTVYVTSDVKGDTQLSFEHTAFQWATKDDILALPIEPYMKSYFEEHT